MSPGANPSSGSYEIRWQSPPQSTHTIVFATATVWTVTRRAPDCHDDHYRCALDGPHAIDVAMLRVVAGTAGGRRLEAPEGEHTRPTTDRVREAMFNSLYSLNAIDDARVLDLFAGSGALGIEALSRGAASATFVESGRRARQVIESNLETLGFDDRAKVVSADGVAYLNRADSYDLLLLDPPYAFDSWPELLGSVADCVVVIESDHEIDVPEHWEVNRARRYGATVLTLATVSRPSGECQ